ncbi:transmembrane 220 family protein [Teredinibacter purpureus]|uniref:transmembrane 220 family protein n=1 Tax=Teredinibacter purpureus TaxID=2731756 RepID=UPI0005F89660|nr:transmembrane 220 family protein [Teredinibacter purpureus]
MFKLLHLLLASLLLYTAWLQLNDPDPLFWVTLYILAAAVPLLAIMVARTAKVSVLTGIAAGYCVAGFVMTLPGGFEYLHHIASESLIQDMSPAKPYIEEARELIGAMFALVVVVSYWAVHQKGWRSLRG